MIPFTFIQLSFCLFLVPYLSFVRLIVLPFSLSYSLFLLSLLSFTFSLLFSCSYLFLYFSFSLFLKFSVLLFFFSYSPYLSFSWYQDWRCKNASILTFLHTRKWLVLCLLQKDNFLTGLEFGRFFCGVLILNVKICGFLILNVKIFYIWRLQYFTILLSKCKLSLFLFSIFSIALRAFEFLDFAKKTMVNQLTFVRQEWIWSGSA